jgi:ketosteroid isomerase-like protein
VIKRCAHVVGLILLASLAVACGRTDPEKALRSAVDQMQQAAQSRDAAAVLSHVSDDFVREGGSMDKAQARRVLLGLFVRNEKINVAATVREVKIDGNLATARIHVLATGGAGLIPQRADGWEFVTAWRREGSAWKLYNAQWSD